MDALEALRIKEAAGIADDEAAVDVRPRDGVPATVRQRLGAVSHQLAAVEKLLEKWMRLPDLKRGVRIKLWVGIFKRDDQSDRDAIVRKAINPAPAIHAGWNRPAEGVRNVAGSNAAGLHVPQFLDTDAIALGIEVVELFGGDELLGERAARALGEHGDFGAQLVAGREVVLGLAVLVDAFVFGDDSGDTVTLIDQFSAAKFFENVHAGGFYEPTE